ncbi:MAG TPA: hypothetical protein VGP33_04260 [Chloroflexota bacterium]|nr:hypothetical protein [Chloroflexota bacterium]
MRGRRHVDKVLLAAGPAFAGWLTVTSPALAHGFAGQPYILPAPLAVYLVAGGAVVLLSFALMVAFVGGASREELAGSRLTLPALALPAVVTTARVVGGSIGSLALALVLVVGWFGPQNPPTANLAEYIVWIYCWAFLVIVTGVLGNLWALLNPWSALYDLAARLGGRRAPWPARQPYPAHWGWWPAIAGYFAFAWFELASGVSNHPAIVATLAALYSVYTFSMLALFGRDAWLRHGELFSVLFNLIGRFSPTEVRALDPTACRTCHSGCTGEQRTCINCWECFRMANRREVGLRPWAVGLLTQSIAPTWDRILFVILTLSTLAFDGILATGPWNTLLLATFPDNEAGQALLRTLGLVALTLLFFLAFSLVISLVRRAGGGRGSLPALGAVFGLTLVPIALAYNAAHNYTYMLLVGQGGIPLLSDPLGRGWNLFGTRQYRISTALTASGTVWYVQLLLIVVGHIIAVYLAHRRAGMVHRRPDVALASQYPLLVLMVLYTMTSLWILAQPITEEA